MTSPHDDQTAAYLWDPAEPAAPDVAAVEEAVKPLRFDPAAKPFQWSGRSSDRPAMIRGFADRRSVRRRWLYGLAAAAAIVLAAGGGYALWRWSWPAGRPWTIAPGPGTPSTQLAVGAPLELTGPEGADITIARVGTMHAERDARLVLRSTQGLRHRLALDRGTVRVRLWAPPQTLVVTTPAGDVIDLGCEFDLTVEAARTLLLVRSGWVQLENGVAESLIPAGAASEMRPGRPPGVPVFEDAAPAFRTSVRALEAGDGTAAAHVDAIATTARTRDVITLLMLAARNMPGSDTLLRRAAELAPPPSGVTVGGILRGDRDGLWRWYNTLPLPPAKSWLRNWRDGLPSWLR